MKPKVRFDVVFGAIGFYFGLVCAAQAELPSSYWIIDLGPELNSPLKLANDGVIVGNHHRYMPKTGVERPCKASMLFEADEMIDFVFERYFRGVIGAAVVDDENFNLLNPRNIFGKISQTKRKRSFFIQAGNLNNKFLSRNDAVNRRGGVPGIFRGVHGKFLLAEFLI